MFRLMTSILTAAFVTSLIAGAVPGKDPDEPVPAKAKAAGPASPEAYVHSDRALSPSEAASRVGQRVTVEFTVQSTGSNPAGFLELYSGQTWMEEGSFFIRFPGETQQKFEGLGIEDIRKHFARKTVRVTGVVQSMTFPTGGTHPVMVVQDMGQIKIIHTAARSMDPPAPPVVAVPSNDKTGFQSPGGAAAPGVKDEGAFFSPYALTRAANEIKEIERRFKRPLVIETFKNIPADRMEKFKAMDPKDAKATNDFFNDWAVDRWKAVGVGSIYVLICKEPSRFKTVVGTNTAKKVFTLSDIALLQNVLLNGLRKANTAKEETDKRQINDKALLDTVALVRKQLESNLNPPRLVFRAYAPLFPGFSGVFMENIRYSYTVT